MKHYDLLIIGGVAAGMSAASQARRVKKDISIGVFERYNFVSYGACGMPYLIDNLVSDENKLIAIDKNKFINERNIQIITDSFESPPSLSLLAGFYQCDLPWLCSPFMNFYIVIEDIDSHIGHMERIIDKVLLYLISFIP